MNQLTASRKKELLVKMAAKGLKPHPTCKSWVAQFFVTDAALKHAHCLLCVAEEKEYSVLFQTSNMSYHLNTQHSMHKESWAVVSPPSSRTIPAIFDDLIDKQKESHLRLALIFARNGVPHALLNDPDFRDELKYSMSRETLKRHMKTLHDRMRNAHFDVIRSAPAACLLCDSTQGKDPGSSWLNFGVVCNKRSYFIRSITCKESLTAEVILGYIAEVVKEIESNGVVVVTAFCSDNGANLRRAIELYIDRHRPWAFFVRCTAHSIQLIVKDAMEAVCPTLQQEIAAAVSLFRGNARVRAFMKFQADSGEKPLRLIRPVCVRWNSYFDAARRILDRWDCFSYALRRAECGKKDTEAATGDAKKFASDEFKEKLVSFCAATGPLAEATDVVQAEAFDITSLWDVLETTAMRIGDIESKERTDFGRRLCAALRSAYAQRWDTNLNHSSLLSIVTFLTPSRRREKGLTSLPPHHLAKFMNYCVGYCLHKEGASENEERRTTLRVALEMELYNYSRGVDAFGGLREFESNFAAYWVAASNRGVAIAAPVVSMTDIACTQADVERSFSVEANVVEGRVNLGEEQIDTEIFIRMNCHHFPGGRPGDLSRTRSRLSIDLTGRSHEDDDVADEDEDVADVADVGGGSGDAGGGGGGGSVASSVAGRSEHRVGGDVADDIDGDDDGDEDD